MDFPLMKALFLTLQTKLPKGWVRAEVLFLVVVLGVVFAYSFATLTTYPRLSFDEGFVIESARNLSELGVHDIVTAPNTFSGLPHIASSIGFSVTVPLAAGFSFFGGSVELARVYALLWMLALLAILYVFARRYFGSWNAAEALLLFATFPPFHSNGRMVMGEIPGFAYLLISLLLLRRSVFAAGIFLGLCFVSRPSLYAFAVLAVVAQVIFEHRRHALRPLLQLGGGTFLSIAASFLLYYPSWLTSTWWHGTLSFLKNPSFGAESSTIQNLAHNLASFAYEPTLIYFSLLIIAIVAAYVLLGKHSWSKGLVLFSFVYGVLVFGYFLKSPGWFKYLLPLQFLTFIFLPAALESIVQKIHQYLPAILQKIRPRVFATGAIAALVILQLVQLMFFANIYAGNDARETAAFVAERASPTAAVAFIHSPQVAMEINADRKYSFFVVNEELLVGDNPLEFKPDERAAYIVMPRDDLSAFSDQFNAARMRVLEEEYVLLESFGRFNVFGLRSLPPQ